MRAAPVMIAMSLAACDAARGPHVDRVEPPTVARGATATVRGDGFCGEGRATASGACDPLPPGEVDFGLQFPAARASVISWSDAAIAVTVPQAAPLGAVDVIVTVDGRSSNGGAVMVTP